jgi:hypothetical protein
MNTARRRRTAVNMCGSSMADTFFREEKHQYRLVMLYVCMNAFCCYEIAIKGAEQTVFCDRCGAPMYATEDEEEDE